MIDTQAIKNKILDLAICGKLTKRQEGEEPGTNLTARIKQSRKESESKRKGKGRLGFSIDTASVNVPFELPDGWDWVPLEFIGANVPNAFADGPFGSNLKKEHYTTQKQVRIIQLSNVGLDGWRNANEKYTTYEHLTTIQRSEVKAGNIVIAKMMPAGRAIIVPHGVSDAFVLSSDCVKFVPHPLLNSQYICYAINSKWFHDQVIQDVHGIGRERTSLSNLKRYCIPVPSLGEQARIVSTMDTITHILNKIDSLQAKYADNLSVLKGKLIDIAIQGKLTEQLPEDGTAEELYQQIQAEKQALIKAGMIKKEKSLYESTVADVSFEIPETWRWVSIGSVCINIQYGSSKKSSSSGKMAVLRMGNIQAGRIVYDKLVYTSDDNEINNYPLEKGDLLFNRTNSMELVGKTAIYRGEMPAIYAGYLVRVTPLIMDSEYLNYVMQTKYYWDYCRMVRIDANGQSNINAEKLKKFCFPLPPLAEQKRIVKYLNELFTVIDAY